ncbi:hypothetical protein EST38_g4028 [Candolleomyces aberdarensis]|uniref:Pheromone n=1 Tax=Candolleomyces aberdarensis TaxID=2316362 RepID=A0A4Q2DS17_9AGAR|nr:hypothetical protein EST38_g4028 [Candolleomyces aberdarensis]
MDSFTTISFTAPTVSVPKDNEGNGTQKSGGYCVVFAKETQIPVDAEGNGTQKSGGYCTIA